jgi:mono/diheme cytochrome c family protein
MRTSRWSAAAVALLLTACSSATHQNVAATPAADAGPANGAAIFQTGIDSAGSHITAVSPPLMPSCAACHHADGSGGVHLPGGAVSADLRHAALVTNQQPPYTVPLLERAISRGIDNQGQHLSPVMPRWKLSPSDLHDVAEYVSTALK